MFNFFYMNEYYDYYIMTLDFSIVQLVIQLYSIKNYLAQNIYGNKYIMGLYGMINKLV